MENRFGTTSDMIVQEVENNGVTQLIAIDSKGLYLTTQDRVDRMLADANRYGVSRQKVNQTLENLGLDPLQLFNSYKHLIKTDTGQTKAKALNPIKASKRRA